MASSQGSVSAIHMTESIFSHIEQNNTASVLALIGRTPLIVKSTTKFNRTPLHVACMTEHGANNLQIIRALCQENELNLIDARTEHGFTAVYIASMQNFDQIVECLVREFEADMTVCDLGLLNCLHIAARNNSERAVKVILELDNGLRLKDNVDSIGRTPVDWAKENNHEGVVKQIEGDDGEERSLEFDNSWMDETNPDMNSVGEIKADDELMFEEEQRNENF